MTNKAKRAIKAKKSKKGGSLLNRRNINYKSTTRARRNTRINNNINRTNKLVRCVGKATQQNGRMVPDVKCKSSHLHTKPKPNKMNTFNVLDNDNDNNNLNVVNLNLNQPVIRQPRSNLRSLSQQLNNENKMLKDLLLKIKSMPQGRGLSRRKGRGRGRKGKQTCKLIKIPLN